MKLLLLMAMQAEADPIISQMGLTESTLFFYNLPMRVFTGEFNEHDIMLVTSGISPSWGVDNVGTQAASVMTSQGIQEFGPDLTLNAGTAGAFAKYGSKIGDVYLASAVQYHDRRIPFPGFDHYGSGIIKLSNSGTMRGLPTAVVSTGNSFDATSEDLEIIHNPNFRLGAPVVKDMEAASIAQIASWSETSLVVIKSITDLIDADRPNEEQFLENLSKASENLAREVIRVVQELK